MWPYIYSHMVIGTLAAKIYYPFNSLWNFNLRIVKWFISKLKQVQKHFTKVVFIRSTINYCSNSTKLSFVFFLRSHVPNGFGRFNLNASLSYRPRNRIFLKLIQNHNHVGIIFLILKFWIFHCSTIFIHVICTGLFVYL